MEVSEVRVTARSGDCDGTPCSHQLGSHIVSYKTGYFGTTYHECSRYMGGLSTDGQVHTHACQAPSNARVIRVDANFVGRFGLAEVEVYNLIGRRLNGVDVRVSES